MVSQDRKQKTLAPVFRDFTVWALFLAKRYKVLAVSGIEGRLNNLIEKICSHKPFMYIYMNLGSSVN